MVYHSPQETAWGVTMRIKVERTLVPVALRILRWGVGFVEGRMGW